MSEPTRLRRLLSSIPLPWGRNGASSGEKALTIHHSGVEVVTVPFDDPSSLQIERLRNALGDTDSGFKASVLAAPLDFLMRTFPEAPPIVRRRKQGLWEEEPDHPLTALLENPNVFYGGEELWMNTVLDLSFGQSYWIKVRNRIGDVVQLWWVPRSSMTAKWPHNGRTFISHYEYCVNGEKQNIAVRDVVHLRYGLDPENPRYGLSRLGALVREVGMDERAAHFTDTVLRNLGVIGIVVSPEAGATGQAAKDAVKETKEYIKAHFTGGGRGGTLALGAPTKVQLLQYNMQGFDISPIRDVSEERVCAVLGIPAAVVGFGTGLQQTKVGATMRELRQLAWTGGILPLQRNVGKQIQRLLLSEFEVNRRQETRFSFDDTQVRALWEDQNEKHTRIREDYRATVIDRAEARRETGRSVRPEDEGWYSTTPTAATPDSEQPPKPTTEPEGGADDDDEDDED